MTATQAPVRAVPRARVSLHAVPDAFAVHRMPRRGLVPRSRLIRQLERAAGTPATVIVAPAGYGKTTLLREWERSGEHLFHWLAPEDAPDLAVRVARARTRTVIVLDDFHAWTDAEAVRDAIPEPDSGRRLVIASRAEPDLPVGRLRAQSAILELRTRELAMTELEAAQLFSAAGLSVDPADVAKLVRRTEGWPVGLFLAALSLAEQHDVGTAVAHFSGGDRLVADYLRDEVMTSLSAEQAAFVRRTSPLDELSGPLCDAVLDRHGSGHVLRALGRSNLLVAPLDRSEERFRYHPLLADMLRADLGRDGPKGAREVHARASAWHEEQGDTHRAVDHAIAAGAISRAAALLWGVVAEGAGCAHTAEVERWLGAFRPPQISARPELALGTALGAALRGDREAAEQWAQTGTRSLERGRRDLRRSLEAGAAITRALIARGGLVQVVRDAARARELAAEAPGWRAMAQALAGTAHHLAGARERARAELEEGAGLAALTAPAVQATCLAQLGLMALEAGETEDAVRLTARARALVQREGGALPVLAFAVSAFACAQRGDVEQAQADVAAARERLKQHPVLPPCYDAEARVALARAELRLSHAAAARALLSQAARAARRTPDATVLQEWIDDAWERADTFAVDAVAGPRTLTTAELRVLRLLPSHLSFRELAERLHVSANTVKTQAHAVYRKLDAGSRSQAVARARAVGLIDSS